MGSKDTIVLLLKGILYSVEELVNLQFSFFAQSTSHYMERGKEREENEGLGRQWERYRERRGKKVRE